MAMEAQIALETATLNAIRSSLSYTEKNSARTALGEPHPSIGNIFLAVWSDGSRENQSRTSLDERMGVNVTITVRMVQPYDRMVVQKDDLLTRLCDVRALVQLGMMDCSIIIAANVLAGFDTSITPIGFREPMFFSRFSPVEECGNDWLAAKSTQSDQPPGLKQTAYFIRARRIQSIVTLPN